MSKPAPKLLTAHIPPARTIAVAIDFSECSRYALEWALMHFAIYSSDIFRLIAIHNPAELLAPSSVPHSMRLNYSEDDTENQLRHQLTQLWSYLEQKKEFSWLKGKRESKEVQVDFCVGSGDPRQVLVDMSNDATILIMGSHGKTGTSRELGSVSQHCLRVCVTPVMVVKEPGFHKPPSSQ